MIWWRLWVVEIVEGNGASSISPLYLGVFASQIAAEFLLSDHG